MELKDIKLTNWGHFNENPASFSVTNYNLERPWSYIYTSDDILLRLSHNGCGYAQIDPPSGIMLFKPERYEKHPLFFIWIQEKGKEAFSNFFKPNTGNILSNPTSYECLFKPEYAEYKLSHNNWKVVTKITISSDSPAIIMKTKVLNCSDSQRELILTPVWRPHNTKADLALWDIPELYQSCKFFNNNGTGIMVETRDPDAEQKNRKYTVMLTDLEIANAELRYDNYVGRGNFENPETLQHNNWLLTNNSNYNLEDFRSTDSTISQLPIAALQGKAVSLNAGEEKEFTVVLHYLREYNLQNLAGATTKSQTLLTENTWKTTVNDHNSLYTDWMNYFNVTTPDAALNQYINEWLIMQLYWVSKLDRGWPTGMRGTRDAAQDYSGLSYIKPDLGKEMLLEMFACQRYDGSFLRQFSCNGPEGKHDTRDYVDSGCWVMELLHDYLCLSGDTNFMNAQVSWLDSDNIDTIATHTKQLINYYLTPDNRGEHGLLKIKGGDWNDSINNAGLEGIGESVMVSCHVVHLLKLTQEIFKDDHSSCFRYSQEAEKLKEATRTHALNKSGFLNGVFTDNQEWLFSDNDPDSKARLNSPVNSFGIIANIFDKEELPGLLDKFEALKGPNGYRLFYPPLGKTPIEKAGRMGTGDLYQGNAENGTVYNHGSQGFLMRAYTTINEGNKALHLLKHILPYDQDIHPVEKCKTEPYGILNCWSEVQGKECEGDKAFLSGTISTVFRAFYSGMLGFKPQLDGFIIAPCLPDDWNNITYTATFRGFKLEINLVKGVDEVLVLNGKELDYQLITPDMLKPSEVNYIKLTR